MAGLRAIAPPKTIQSARPAALGSPPPPTRAEGRPATALDRPTIFPQGPRLLGLGTRKDNTTGGPGVKPADFDGTQPEWVWYWASARYHKDPLDPRSAPYGGGAKGDWEFADPIGATQAVRSVGGTTPDFIYHTPGGEIIVRMQGFHWHTAAPEAQQARDAYLAVQMGTTATRVESVEDGEIMDDVTGNKAVRLLADILAGRSRIGAISGGLAEPPRYGHFEGVL